MMPSELDVMAALGNDEAVSLLRPELEMKREPCSRSCSDSVRVQTPKTARVSATRWSN